MTKIGLDIMKIKSFSSRKEEVKKGNSLPGPIIHSKKSLRKIQLKHLINSKDALLPIKTRGKNQEIRSSQEGTEVEFKHLIEMTTSLTNFTTEKGKEC